MPGRYWIGSPDGWQSQAGVRSVRVGRFATSILRDADGDKSAESSFRPETEMARSIMSRTLGLEPR